MGLYMYVCIFESFLEEFQFSKEVLNVYVCTCMCDMTHSYVWHESFIYGLGTSRTLSVLVNKRVLDMYAIHVLYIRKSGVNVRRAPVFITERRLGAEFVVGVCACAVWCDCMRCAARHMLLCDMKVWQDSSIAGVWNIWIAIWHVYLCETSLCVHSLGV